MYLYFMANKKKKLLVSLTVLVLLFVALSLFLNSVIKNKVENYLSNLPQNIDLTYSKLTISTISGSVSLSDVKLVVKKDTIALNKDSLFIKSIEVSNVSYWDYIVNNKITIKEIDLVNPKGVYNKSQDSQKKNDFLKGHTKKPISIHKLNIEDDTISI